MADTKKITTAIGGVPEPSQTAQDAIAEHVKMGHSVFDPRTGSNLAGTRNVAVVAAPEHSAVFARTITAQDHDQFVGANHALFTKHRESAILSKRDPITGHESLHVAGLTPSKIAAIDVARHVGESHVYDLAKGEKIPSGAAGEHQMSHIDIDQRFDHLRKSAPVREPYSGTHFSDKKLDRIDGARRGEPGHADAARVHLGAQTGHGVDAPAGFYTVRAGHTAPAVEAAKPHAHPVRGQFAIASTDHPIFQNGYAQASQQAQAAGAKPDAAHLLGLNAAEKALEDAGFDGYSSPARPGITFHFGSHSISHSEVTHKSK